MKNYGFGNENFTDITAERKKYIFFFKEKILIFLIHITTAVDLAWWP